MGKARVTVWHKATIQYDLDRGAIEVTDDGLSIMEAYRYWGRLFCFYFPKIENICGPTPCGLIEPQRVIMRRNDERKICRNVACRSGSVDDRLCAGFAEQ